LNEVLENRKIAQNIREYENSKIINSKINTKENNIMKTYD
jgi:hypothetical protein